MKKWILMASLCLVAVAAQAQSYKEYVRKALDAMSMDSTEVAERLFREAMRVEPAQRSNAMIYYQIGRMQEHRGKLEKALESYTMGLNVAPHVLPLRMARAKLYMQLGNKEKALVDYSDVLDWKADEQEALFMRAYIYTEQRLYKKARTDYEALLKLNPAHEEARIGLVLLNEKDNRPREARADQCHGGRRSGPCHPVCCPCRFGTDAQAIRSGRGGFHESDFFGTEEYRLFAQPCRALYRDEAEERSPCRFGQSHGVRS